MVKNEQALQQPFFRENEEKRKENKIIDLLMQEFEADEVIFVK